MSCAASPGSQPSTTSSSSSTSDSLSKFYQTPTAGGPATGSYLGSSTTSSCDQRAGLVGGFPTGHGYPAVYPSDCLSPYTAYPYAGSTGGGCLDSYLKVRPSPYPVSTDYPVSYFSRVAGLHHHHHAAAAAAASRSAGHVVGYDYGSA